MTPLESAIEEARHYKQAYEAMREENAILRRQLAAARQQSDTYFATAMEDRG